MFSLVVNTNDKRQSSVKGRLLLFAFLFSISLCKASNSFMPGDSVKGKYDINDPRNPHCPCHQYQKLADEEYKRLLDKEKNKINLPATDLRAQYNLAGQSGERNFQNEKQDASWHLFSFFNKKKKISRRKIRTAPHHPTKHRVADRLSRCFHF